MSLSFLYTFNIWYSNHIGFIDLPKIQLENIVNIYKMTVSLFSLCQIRGGGAHKLQDFKDLGISPVWVIIVLTASLNHLLNCLL